MTDNEEYLLNEVRKTVDKYSNGRLNYNSNEDATRIMAKYFKKLLWGDLDEN